MPLRLILVLACLLATVFGLWRLEIWSRDGREQALAGRDAYWQAKITADQAAAATQALIAAARADEFAALRINHLQTLLTEAESRADALVPVNHCGLSRASLRALASP